MTVTAIPEPAVTHNDVGAQLLRDLLQALDDHDTEKSIEVLQAAYQWAEEP